MSKIQKAVSARLKLLGIDFTQITSIGEALDASLRAINQLMSELAKKETQIADLEDTVDTLKRTVAEQSAKIEALELKVAKQKKLISEMRGKLKENDERIAALESDNAALRDSNQSLKDELDAARTENAKFKKKINAVECSGGSLPLSTLHGICHCFQIPNIPRYAESDYASLLGIYGVVF